MIGGNVIFKQLNIGSMKMKNQNTPESDLYFFAKMAGIQHEGGERYSYDGRSYKARVRRLRDPALFKSVGGKVRAYKLVRHAMMIDHISNQPNGEHIAGIVATSLDAVNQRYPTLRSHYTSARSK